MKKSAWCFLLAVTMLVAITAVGDEKPWFDMEKCAFCGQLTKHPGLLDHMTCEYHEVSNGYLMVTVVDSEYRPAYIEAEQAMEKLGADMTSGKVDPTTVYMCGSCEAYGGLMMSGANIEHIPTRLGDIMLITSDKPDVIAAIKEYGRRSTEEMAKLEQKAGKEE